MKQYEYSFLIILTTKCNLNCTGCSIMCSNENNKQWFINKDDFIKQLHIIKEKLPNLSHIDLTGGETLIHPEFIDLCFEAHKILPHTHFNIWTNGILIDSFSDELIKTLYENNFSFQKTLYPKLTDMHEKQKNRFNNLNLELKVSGARVFFNKFNFNLEKKHNPYQQFLQCYHFKQPYQFILYNGKIYNCCMMPHFVEALDIEEHYFDFLDINMLNSEQDLIKLAKSPKKACSYCNISDSSIEENFPWSLDHINKNYYLLDLKDLYLYKYKEYEQLYNNSSVLQYLPKFLKNKNNYSFIGSDKGNRAKVVRHYYKKFFGILDILIIYENNNIDNLQINKISKLLKYNNYNTNINLYFISINNNLNTEEYIYDLFTPFEHHQNYNTWFYKISSREQLKSFIETYTFSPYFHIISLNNNNDNNNILKKERYRKL